MCQQPQPRWRKHCDKSQVHSDTRLGLVSRHIVSKFLPNSDPVHMRHSQICSSYALLPGSIQRTCTCASQLCQTHCYRGLVSSDHVPWTSELRSIFAASQVALSKCRVITLPLPRDQIWIDGLMGRTRNQVSAPPSMCYTTKCSPLVSSALKCASNR